MSRKRHHPMSTPHGTRRKVARIFRLTPPPAAPTEASVDASSAISKGVDDSQSTTDQLTDKTGHGEPVECKGSHDTTSSRPFYDAVRDQFLSRNETLASALPSEDALLAERDAHVLCEAQAQLASARQSLPTPSSSQALSQGSAPKDAASKEDLEQDESDKDGAGSPLNLTPPSSNPTASTTPPHPTASTDAQQQTIEQRQVAKAVDTTIACLDVAADAHDHARSIRGLYTRPVPTAPMVFSCPKPTRSTSPRRQRIAPSRPAPSQRKRSFCTTDALHQLSVTPDQQKQPVSATDGPAPPVPTLSQRDQPTPTTKRHGQSNTALGQLGRPIPTANGNGRSVAAVSPRSQNSLAAHPSTQPIQPAHAASQRTQRFANLADPRLPRATAPTHPPPAGRSPLNTAAFVANNETRAMLRAAARWHEAKQRAGLSGTQRPPTVEQQGQWVITSPANRETRSNHETPGQGRCQTAYEP